MVRDMPDVCVQRRTTPGGDTEAPRPLPSSEHLRLETALAGSFELVAGIALFALAATALVVVLVPRSAATRLEFAVELVFVGVALVVLALLLSRRSARAVMRPLEVLDVALAAVTCGDFTVHVELERAAAEIQSVGDSVNALVRELARLRVIEIERTKDQRVRRELSEVVHASLDLDHVVQRAVEVVGPALDVDRVHIRLRDGDGNGGGDQGWLAAEWRRSDDVASVLPVSAAVDSDPLIALIGVTDDRRAVVIDDAIDEARFDVEQRGALDALGVRASLTYPLVVGTRVAGVLVASEQRAPRSWSDGEVMLTEGFALEIGRALDHALSFRPVRRDGRANGRARPGQERIPVGGLARATRPARECGGLHRAADGRVRGIGERGTTPDVAHRGAQWRTAPRHHRQPLDDVSYRGGNLRPEARADRPRRRRAAGL